MLGIKHDASVIIRSTFDWNRSSISRLELDAVPHNWIPYARTGFRKILETERWNTSLHHAGELDFEEAMDPSHDRL